MKCRNLLPIKHIAKRQLIQLERFGSVYNHFEGIMVLIIFNKLTLL